MKATVQFVRESFDRFNTLCFEGVLPPIPITLTTARTFLGKVVYKSKRDIFGNTVSYRDFVLRISTSYDLPENELEDVVIHEMIHYYIAWRCIHDTSSHGTVFRSMMDRINLKYGRHISVHHRIEEGELEQKYRANRICVSRLENGDWGVTVCAETKIFEIHRNLPRYYKLESMVWYGTIDPFFNRFPRCRTPKIYRITRAELDEHLADAVPLKCDGHSIEPV